MLKGVALTVEQVFAATWALRRLHLSVWRDLLPTIWRPIVATGAMAAVLLAAGLGWQPLPLALLPVAIAIGGAAYGLCLLALWLAVGRPAGAEADGLALLAKVARRREHGSPGATSVKPG